LCVLLLRVTLTRHFDKRAVHNAAVLRCEAVLLTYYNA
jgi:hypothetical protein